MIISCKCTFHKSGLIELLASAQKVDFFMRFFYKSFKILNYIIYILTTKLINNTKFAIKKLHFINLLCASEPLLNTTFKSYFFLLENVLILKIKVLGLVISKEKCFISKTKHQMRSM